MLINIINYGVTQLYNILYQVCKAIFIPHGVFF